MTDFLTAAGRSERMSRIKGKNTRPEIILRKVLHGHGLRYRLHRGDLPGKPDLVFPRYRAVVFVHGCFWHHHQGCKIAAIPRSNTAFWLEKFRKNAARDERNATLLKQEGWRVFVIWECELASMTKAEAVGKMLEGLIRVQ